MAHISTDEAKAWIEQTKLEGLTVPFSVDTALENQVSVQVLAQLQGVYDTSTWINDSTTPELVRSIISMFYCSWYYDRAYGDDDAGAASYSRRLRENAEALLAAIVSGTLDLPLDTTTPLGVGQPGFFPNDASSANCPTSDNPSDGGPAFLMGVLF
jgi:hypothetical protein